MYNEIELESTRYWNIVKERDEQWERRLRRRVARERLLLCTVFVFSSCLIMAGMASGLFDDVDVVGTLRTIRSFLPFA